MNRYFSSFIVTTLVYVLIFTSFLYSIDLDKKIASQPKQNLNNIKFTVIEKKTEPKKEIKKEIKKEHKKVVEKVEKKEIKPKPKKKKIVKKKPKPVKKKIVKKTKPKKKIKKIQKKAQKKEEPKKIVKKEPIKKEIVKKTPQKKVQKHQIKQQKKIVKKPKDTIDEDILKAKQNLYFKSIKKAISKNKIYPRVAARRGIQGDVKVNFTISKNGDLLKYDIINGHRIFKKSIIKAFEKTFPVKPPKDILLSNTNLSITIAYRLN